MYRCRNPKIKKIIFLAIAFLHTFFILVLPAQAFSSVSSGLKSCAANPACAATLAQQSAGKAALTTSLKSTLATGSSASAKTISFSGKNAIGAFTRSGSFTSSQMIDAGGKVFLFGGLAHLLGLNPQKADDLKRLALSRFNTLNGHSQATAVKLDYVVKWNNGSDSSSRTVYVPGTVVNSFSTTLHSNSFVSSNNLFYGSGGNCSTTPQFHSAGFTVNNTNIITGNITTDFGSYPIYLGAVSSQPPIYLDTWSVDPTGCTDHPDAVQDFDDLNEQDKQTALDLLTSDDLVDALSFDTIPGLSPDVGETLEFDSPLYDENGNMITGWTNGEEDVEAPVEPDGTTTTTTTTENDDGTTTEETVSNRTCTSRYQNTVPFTSQIMTTFSGKFPFDFLGDLYAPEVDFCISFEVYGRQQQFCELTQIISVFVYILSLVLSYNLVTRIA